MIFITGFMGTGKTTVSKLLAEKLGLNLVDTDNYVEEKTRRKIPAIFSNDGEDFFRDLETRALSEVIDDGYDIVSCGGGIVLREENRKMMQEAGKIFCLTATPETIYNRVCTSTNRPLLNGNMSVESIRTRLHSRRKQYDACNPIKIRTDSLTPEQVVDEICRQM